MHTNGWMAGFPPPENRNYFYFPLQPHGTMPVSNPLADAIILRYALIGSTKILMLSARVYRGNGRQAIDDSDARFFSSPVCFFNRSR